MKFQVGRYRHACHFPPSMSNKNIIFKNVVKIVASEKWFGSSLKARSTLYNIKGRVFFQMCIQIWWVNSESGTASWGHLVLNTSQGAGVIAPRELNAGGWGEEKIRIRGSRKRRQVPTWLNTWERGRNEHESMISRAIGRETRTMSNNYLSLFF